MQRVFTFVQHYEKMFAQMMLEQSSEEHKKEIVAKRREPYRENGVRYQQIDIYYHGVGIIRLATAEEMEASFQKHIESKQPNKQKTA